MSGKQVNKKVDLYEYSDRIEGKSYLNWDTFRNFINSPIYSEIDSSTKNLSIIFMIDRFTLLNLNGLIWLLLIGNRFRSKGHVLALALPKDEEQLAYIKNLDFQILANNLFEINPSYLDNIEKINPLSVIKEVDNNSLDNFVSSIDGYLGEILTQSGAGGISNLGPRAELERRRYYKSIVELSKNVVEHSGKEAKRGQGYAGIALSGKKINLCVVDNGIGFLSSLGKKGVNVNNDEDAIREAFKYSYSNRQALKGIGIFTVLKLIGEIGGNIRIRSGVKETQLRIMKDTATDEKINKLIEEMKFSTLKHNFPGVQYDILFNRPLPR